MDNNKADFSQTIMELETLSANFKQYKDAEQYAEVA
jgi:hypothetical protein|tara:strand:- start:3010 stop:3117 length:108 start_codon:yes stop_codon:yes gene_type:complete